MPGYTNWANNQRRKIRGKTAHGSLRPCMDNADWNIVSDHRYTRQNKPTTIRDFFHTLGNIGHSHTKHTVNKYTWHILIYSSSFWRMWKCRMSATVSIMRKTSKSASCWKGQALSRFGCHKQSSASTVHKGITNRVRAVFCFNVQNRVQQTLFCLFYPISISFYLPSKAFVPFFLLWISHIKGGADNVLSF